MNIALITGSGGLIGSESVEFFSEKFDLVIGIDNDMRSHFFGDAASTRWNIDRLNKCVPNYQHYSVDIRDKEAIEKIFNEYRDDIKLIVHAAAQPSHDWAARDPILDFSVNANGTLIMLELTRLYAYDAVFIHCSTNKVYGDTPNSLPLIELDTRYELDQMHTYFKSGIDESMSIDQTKHSLFGASKAAADLLVQEYGRYFGMKTGVFRGGCLTGPMHSGAELHGFLSYLVKCVITGTEYKIFGYKGKQVRDNIHSFDLVSMFWEYYLKPRVGEVYNCGGSRHSNCSMLEAIAIIEKMADKKLNYRYVDENRVGDHIWYISNINKFKEHYPNWSYKYDLNNILDQIFKSKI